MFGSHSVSHEPIQVMNIFMLGAASNAALLGFTFILNSESICARNASCIGGSQFGE